MSIRAVRLDLQKALCLVQNPVSGSDRIQGANCSGHEFTDFSQRTLLGKLFAA
jgi:hypothetical protein